jgi:hypothetical protein
MHKVVVAVAVPVLALMAGLVSISPSFAQQRCTEIEFPSGKDTAVLSGIAPVDKAAEGRLAVSRLNANTKSMACPITLKLAQLS